MIDFIVLYSIIQYYAFYSSTTSSSSNSSIIVILLLLVVSSYACTSSYIYIFPRCGLLGPR